MEPIRPTPLVWHYCPAESLASVASQGILSPARLINTGWFQSVRDNYWDRAQAACKKLQLNDEDILDYLDFQRGDFCDEYQGGRNMVFALLSIIPSGVSEGHDEMIMQPRVGIDFGRLCADEAATKLYIVEWNEGEPAFEVQPMQIYDMLDVDWIRSCWKPGSDLLFENVPHLAIYSESGRIDPKYLVLPRV